MHNSSNGSPVRDHESEPSESLSDVILELEKTPQGLGTGIRRFLLIFLRPVARAGDDQGFVGSLSARFFEAVNQTLAEWMVTGQDGALWDAVEETRRAVRDVMRQRGEGVSTLEPVDLHAERIRAVADFLEAHLQPASISSMVSKLSGVRYASRVNTLKVLLDDDPNGAVRPEDLVEKGIHKKDQTESAAKTLRSMVNQGLLVKKGHGGGYRLSFLGRRVAQAFLIRDRREASVLEESSVPKIGGGSDSRQEPASSKPLGEGWQELFRNPKSREVADGEYLLKAVPAYDHAKESGSGLMTEGLEQRDAGGRPTGTKPPAPRYGNVNVKAGINSRKPIRAKMSGSRAGDPKESTLAGVGSRKQD